MSRRGSMATSDVTLTLLHLQIFDGKEKYKRRHYVPMAVQCQYGKVKNNLNWDPKINPLVSSYGTSGPQDP